MLLSGECSGHSLLFFPPAGKVRGSRQRKMKCSVLCLVLCVTRLLYLVILFSPFFSYSVVMMPFEQILPHLSSKRKHFD
jgi:hypothetical protein